MSDKEPVAVEALPSLPSHTIELVVGDEERCAIEAELGEESDDNGSLQITFSHDGRILLHAFFDDPSMIATAHRMSALALEHIHNATYDSLKKRLLMLIGSRLDDFANLVNRTVRPEEGESE